jgi:hypothetical protein
MKGSQQSLSTLVVVSSGHPAPVSNSPHVSLQE